MIPTKSTMCKSTTYKSTTYKRTLKRICEKRSTTDSEKSQGPYSPEITQCFTLSYYMQHMQHIQNMEHMEHMEHMEMECKDGTNRLLRLSCQRDRTTGRKRKAWDTDGEDGEDGEDEIDGNDENDDENDDANDDANDENDGNGNVLFSFPYPITLPLGGKVEREQGMRPPWGKRKEANNFFSNLESIPFALQRMIMEFFPRLPRLDPLIFQTIHLHYQSSRVCNRCGRFLPRRREKYHCLCRQKVHRRSGLVDSFYENHAYSRFQVYERPLYIFKTPSVSEDTFYRIMCTRVSSKEWYYLLSPQPEWLFSFRLLLRLCDDMTPSARETLLEFCDARWVTQHPFLPKVFNGNTGFRSHSDCFVTVNKDELNSYLSSRRSSEIRQMFQQASPQDLYRMKKENCIPHHDHHHEDDERDDDKEWDDDDDKEWDGDDEGDDKGGEKGSEKGGGDKDEKFKLHVPPCVTLQKIQFGSSVPVQGVKTIATRLCLVVSESDLFSCKGLIRYYAGKSEPRRRNTSGSPPPPDIFGLVHHKNFVKTFVMWLHSGVLKKK